MLSKGHIDLVIGCGDLPAEYLEALSDRYSAPLLFVRGNHDPPAGREGYPAGAEIDGRIVQERGLLLAGLEGSPWYSGGPHQYRESEMLSKVLRLRVRLRGRKLDILATHAPPAGVHEGDDRAHHGLKALRRAVEWLRPRFLLHGHVHPYGRPVADVELGQTRVINVAGHRLIEISSR